MQKQKQKSGNLGLALAAIGIVFGDIGTSPIYAISETLKSPGLTNRADSIFGIISFIFWSLTLVIGVKYLFFITRANNQGEGGIFAILSLFQASDKLKSRKAIILATALGIMSAALLFADSLITPALSIMSAIEGINGIYPDAKEWVVPVSSLIILALYAIQRHGTKTLSRLFSPIMICWFTAIAAFGTLQIIDSPQILFALSPVYAWKLISILSLTQILTLLGSILLAVTGAEAIYADMGHFGRKPIMLGWWLIPAHSLLLSYLGQGAWLLTHHYSTSSSVTPFFEIVPHALIVPMVILATLAGVIASQATISGMFSLAGQAIQLGYLPRFKILQTSETEKGQIYISKINLLLLIGCLSLVLIFKSSSGLASAYGFAVSATMLLTTLAFSMVVYFIWEWSWWRLFVFCAIALPLDCLFFSATLMKLPASHYLTPLIASCIIWLLVSWRIGNNKLVEKVQRIDMPLEFFIELLDQRQDLYKQDKPAIFFQNLPFPPEAQMTPFSLLRQVQITSMLYQPTVIVEYLTAPSPRIQKEDRIRAYDLSHNVYLVHVYHGYYEQISNEPVINIGKEYGWWENSSEIIYFSAKEDLSIKNGLNLSLIYKWPFSWLHGMDENISHTLKLPAIQFVELTMPIDF